MLSVKEKESRKQIRYVCIEDLVPQNHLLRKVENAIDFGFVRAEVKDLYSVDKGRPSIDPVTLVKLCVINYMFGYNSMRRTIRECEVNVAYRWFIGYDLTETIPHFTTFGKNYKRRFEGTDIFERVFIRVLAMAIENGLVDKSTVYIDGTHIKANANTHKNYKKLVENEARSYDAQLRKEINEDREEYGKKPFDDDDESGAPEQKEITVSKSDPESGLFHKGEHRKCFAYNAQVACDKHGWVLAATVNSGNKHDSTLFEEVYETVKENVGKPDAAVLDAGYLTPHIAKHLIDDCVDPYMPYKRPMTKKGFFPKYEYAYDEYYDCYVCPNNQPLEYSTTNRDGYREYKSNQKICVSCPHREQCTLSTNHTKVVTRHIWQDYLELVEDNRHTKKGKEVYERRKETVERVFADGKEKHGLRFTRHNGLAKVKTQVLLTFMVMNLKKLAKLTGGVPAFFQVVCGFFHFRRKKLAL
ncbi:MAG: IS1182 family transposase [Firmicutes bacterium]|nr:IS1182 family transposase [Bacillota bacterium]